MNKFKKKRVAAIFHVNDTSSQVVVNTPDETFGEKLITMPTLNRYFLKNRLNAVTPQTPQFKTRKIDLDRGLDEVDKFKLYISELAFLAGLDDIGQPWSKPARPVPPELTKSAKELVRSEFNAFGVLGFAEHLNSARECIFENRSPHTNVDRLVCELFTYDSLGTIMWTTLASRQCYESLQDLKDSKEDFLLRNKRAHDVTVFLNSTRDENRNDNLYALYHKSVGVVLDQLFKDWEVSDFEKLVEKRSFMAGIPNGVPLEGQKTFNQKVVAEITDDGFDESAFRWGFFGHGSLGQGSFFCKYMEVAKNLTRNRGISEMPRRINAGARVFADSIQDTLEKNSFGSIQLKGQDSSVDAIMDWNLDDFATLDSSNCTDSYGYFHLDCFPEKVQKVLLQYIPAAIIVDGVVHVSHIIAYMGSGFTTAIGTAYMWAMSYVAGVICENFKDASRSGLPFVSKSISRDHHIAILKDLNERITDDWLSCDFTIVPSRCEKIRVWNDDVIIPAPWVPYFETLALGSGFILNQTKSYTRSSLEDGGTHPDVVINGINFRIRESCGAFAVENMDTGYNVRARHIPTLTRKPIKVDAIGMVRLASVAEEFHKFGCYTIASRLRSVVAKCLPGGGFSDNFSDVGHFDDVPETITLEPLSQLVPTPVTLRFHVQADYVPGKKARNENTSIAYQIYKAEHYYDSLYADKIGRAVRSTDEFNVPVMDSNGEVYDFARYYGITAGHMKYAEFIKSEEDISLVRVEDTHWCDILFMKLLHGTNDVYLLCKKNLALRSAEKLVETANRLSGYAFQMSGLSSAIDWLLRDNPRCYLDWSGAQIAVAASTLNPNHVSLVEYVNAPVANVLNSPNVKSKDFADYDEFKEYLKFKQLRAKAKSEKNSNSKSSDDTKGTSK